MKISEKRYVSVYPYNASGYFRNAVFDPKKNKGVEASVFFTLKKYLEENNIEINTYDIKTEKPPFKYVYFDMPYPWNLKAWGKIVTNIGKNVLICNESSLVVPFNYWKILHLFFSKVFTWYGPFIDDKKYKIIRLPKSSYGINTKPKKFSEKKFLVLINKNILPFYPFKIINSFGKELYSERIRGIEFFEKTIPDKFSLYGRGWNKPKKLNLTEKLFGFKKYSSYEGEVDDKIELISNFKYSLCFENLTDVNGYVTEKIFDCLKAKCVPIYFGANDIEKYIPKNCFIDFRDFDGYSMLLDFLNSIDEKTYGGYIKNIEELLKDKKFVNMWFEDQFAKFFLNEILGIK